MGTQTLRMGKSLLGKSSVKQGKEARRSQTPWQTALQNQAQKAKHVGTQIMTAHYRALLVRDADRVEGNEFRYCDDGIKAER